MDQLEIKMRQPHGKKLLQSLASDWQIYVLLLPVVIWFALAKDCKSFLPCGCRILISS